MEEENSANNNIPEEDIVTIPDEENDGADAAAKIKKTKDELRVCEKDKKEYLENWQRARADFLNYKNEEGKRMEDLARFVIVGLIQEVLPVLDSFDLALVAIALRSETSGSKTSAEVAAASPVTKGMYMIQSQFEDVLRKRGLERMIVAPGMSFDPALHESVGEVESEQPPGMIAEEIERGYLLNSRVVRPARVKLAKSKM